MANRCGDGCPGCEYCLGDSPNPEAVRPPASDDAPASKSEAERAPSAQAHNGIGQRHHREPVSAPSLVESASDPRWYCTHCLTLVRESELGGRGDDGVGHSVGDEPPSYCGPCEPLTDEALYELLQELHHERWKAKQASRVSPPAVVGSATADEPTLYNLDELDDLDTEVSQQTSDARVWGILPKTTRRLLAIARYALSLQQRLAEATRERDTQATEILVALKTQVAKQLGVELRYGDDMAYVVQRGMAAAERRIGELEAALRSVVDTYPEVEAAPLRDIARAALRGGASEP